MRRFLAPGAWQIAFRYLDEDYELLVNGLDDTITESDLPVDEEKEKKIRSFFYPAWITAAIWVGTAIYYLDIDEWLLVDDEGIYPLILGLIAFIIVLSVSYIKKWKLLNKSRVLRQNALESLCD